MILEKFQSPNLKISDIIKPSYPGKKLKLAAGIKALKFNRILRVIEEAADQDFLINMLQLILFFNITLITLRKMLKELRDKGIYAPAVRLRKDLRKIIERFEYDISLGIF